MYQCLSSENVCSSNMRRTSLLAMTVFFNEQFSQKKALRQWIIQKYTSLTKKKKSENHFRFQQRFFLRAFLSRALPQFTSCPSNITLLREQSMERYMAMKCRPDLQCTSQTFLYSKNIGNRFQKTILIRVFITRELSPSS